MGQERRRASGRLRAASGLVVLLVVCAVGSQAWAGPKQRTETQSYLLGGDVLLDCDTGIGGGCFELMPRDQEAHVVIRDATGMRVDAFYEYLDPAGATHGIGVVCGEATLRVPDGASVLRVYVHTATAGLLGCAVDLGTGEVGTPAVGTTGEIEVTFTLGAKRKAPRNPIDIEQECLEPVPASVGVSGVTDDGGRVSIETRVLLDGVELEVGEQVFGVVAQAYDPLGVDLIVNAFQSVEFVGTDAAGLISQAKARFKGEVPAGTDVVYVLTSKDIQALGQSAVIGLADCIGGIRYPNRSFAVGEVVGFENLAFGPFTLFLNATAKTAAHEIGHLLGGHHHYANCVEGVFEETPEEPSPCTLMFNDLTFGSINFSVVNGAVVRGHAVDHAAP